MGYDNWKCTDPALEDEGCPRCGGELEGDKYEVTCVECKWFGEADYEYLTEPDDRDIDYDIV